MKQPDMCKIAVLILIMFGVGINTGWAAEITTTAQGGKWSDKTTWIGGVVPTATDNVIITSTVTANGGSYSSTSYLMTNLTVNSGGKIIREKNSGGLSYLKISGNLTNNGEIIDQNDYFDIQVNGNLINNGQLKPRYITLLGANQQLSGTKAIECKQINLNMTDEFAVAVSNLMFKNCRVNSGVSTTNKKLKMGKYSLSLFADSIRYDSYYGSVSSSSEIVIPIVFDGIGILNAENSLVGGTIFGNVTVKSLSYAFFKDLTIEGNLTLDEGIKVSSQVNLTKLRVKGDFTNYADLNKDTVKVRQVKFAPRSMYLFVYGNSNNLGSTGISTVYPITNGKTISLSGNYDANVYIQQAENSDKPGGKVLINSEVNISGKLDVYANLEIEEGGTLNLLNKTLTSPIYVRTENASLTNNGAMNRYHRLNNAWSNRAYNVQPGTYADYELREWSDRIEGVDISVFNNQNYPGLPGSVKRWWRLNPVGTGKVKTYTLKLYYDESMLNGQKEKNLKVFRSGDKGTTWELVSVGSNAVLDTIENSISIGKWNIATSMLTEFGDFVISSGDGSVPIPSNIIVNLTGRKNVRLGAPNRYSIHLYNAGNTRSEPFITAIMISDNIVFKQVEIPTNEGKFIFPIDSIGSQKDDMQFFYIPYLEPNEEYSFDVIVVGVQNGTKNGSVKSPYVAACGILNYAASGDLSHDFHNFMTGSYYPYSFDELNEEEQKKLDEKINQVLKQIEIDKKKEGSGAFAQAETMRRIFENGGDAGRLIHWLGVNLGTSLEIIDRTTEPYRQSAWNWLNQKAGLVGSNDLKLLSGKLMEGEMVTSWDPNEKLGPTGYGESNFISKKGKMNYTIAFENKKEATAAAYRIQIMDTLSESFDPETVKFGATSHSGPNYNWKMERNGNILKWDIEGIELPPNVTPPEGEGFVSFSVELRGDLETGSEILNRATIIFDINPPITTNTWKNVLDTESPHSTMNPINYLPGDSIINLSCTAYDDENGSGINKYMFFSSVNNGPFNLLGESFESTIQFQVSKEERNTYRFYAMSADNVDNVESSLPALVELKSFPLTNRLLEMEDDRAKIYPNPTDGVITIDFYAVEQAETELKIYSITGELLFINQFGKVGAGHKELKTDISRLSKGVYLARFVHNNKIRNYKLIRD